MIKYLPLFLVCLLGCSMLCHYPGRRYWEWERFNNMCGNLLYNKYCTEDSSNGENYTFNCEYQMVNKGMTYDTTRLR